MRGEKQLTVTWAPKRKPILFAFTDYDMFTGKLVFSTITSSHNKSELMVSTYITPPSNVITS